MKAVTAKPDSETQRIKQRGQRPASRDGVSAGESAAPATAFVDNRPRALAQRQLQAGIDQPSRVQEQAQRQAVIDAGPRQVAQRQQWAQMVGEAIAGLSEKAVETAGQQHRSVDEGRVQGNPATDILPRLQLGPSESTVADAHEPVQPTTPIVQRYRITCMKNG